MGYKEYKINEERGNVFSDKMKISAVILDKEGYLIGVFHELIRKVRAGFLTNKQEIESSDSYENAWRIVAELYDFLEFNKIKDIQEKNEKNEIVIEECKEIHEIIDKYSNLEKVGLNDLQKAVKIMRHILSLAGYHEDEFRKEGEEEWGEDDL
jgi:hypothetical protein